MDRNTSLGAAIQPLNWKVKFIKYFLREFGLFFWPGEYFSVICITESKTLSIESHSLRQLFRFEILTRFWTGFLAQIIKPRQNIYFIKGNLGPFYLHCGKWTKIHVAVFVPEGNLDLKKLKPDDHNCLIIFSHAGHVTFPLFKRLILLHEEGGCGVLKSQIP